MAFNLSLGSISSNRSSTPSIGSGVTITYGRVVDVILDENHPEYKNRGGGIAINGVFYKPLSSNASEKSLTELPFAYQQGAQIKVVPLIGEIVRVSPLPVPSGNDFNGKTRRYYTNILNIWNNANSNFYPDVDSNFDIDFTQQNRFIELGNINPIASSPGDVQIEGRQGQSLRFSGGKALSNPWTDDDNVGKPLIILSNGQKETKEGFSLIGEDVNEDSSSIYMVSDHQVPLVQASEKRDAWNDPPIKGDQFKGNQVIINGGRLYFNAKENDIQLSSVSSIGMNTEGTVNIDSKDYMCLDGSQIYLGVKSRTATQNRKEPVVLGNQLESFLSLVLNLLEGMADDMANAVTGDGIPIPAINKRGVAAKPTIQALKRRINPNGTSTLKSKKVYTE